MRTVIIGGGKGCRAIMELSLGGFLKELVLDIICVVDPDYNAPGMEFARAHDIPTGTDTHRALTDIPDIDLVIELTGSDEVLEQILEILPHGARIIDHMFAHIFWDLVNAQEHQRRQLNEITALEKKIERERFFLQKLFDSMPDPIVVLDSGKKAIKINKSFSEFSMFSMENAMGKSCEELLSKTALAGQCRETAPLLDEILATGRGHTQIWKTDEPAEAYWEVTLTPITDAEGNIEAILGVWHRITEKVRLRREIESAEQRFRNFIDSAHDWISIKDLEGRYLIVNPVIAEAFHTNVEDFIGRRPEEILPADLARTIKQHDREMLSSHHHKTYEEVVSIDGRDHYFQTLRFPLTDYRGEITGTCTIMRDITSEKELRGQVIQAAKLAAVGKLAAGVAHEINNPLTGILAYAEDMLEDLDDKSSMYDDLKVIVRETLRCRDIVRNLLNFARQEEPQLETISVNRVIGRALLLVEKLPQFRNIDIKKNINVDIPTIEGDPKQLQQVLLNLMLNATEAMKEKGTIVLTTDYDRRHDKCVVEVEDSGPGIPENLIDKIFEPFFSTKGTNGLGLAVSWGIIERHRGAIEVDRAEGGGAIFRIILPAFVKPRKLNI